MIGSPLAAGVAKVAAVGILMAAGAGGIYIVSRTGDPGSGNPRFTFEPAAVVTVENGSPVLASTVVPGSCGSLAPDRVVAAVAHESSKAVEAWIDEVGFDLVERIEGKRYVLLYVRVPFAASPAASRALTGREGVHWAEPDAEIAGPTPCTLGP